MNVLGTSIDRLRSATKKSMARTDKVRGTGRKPASIKLYNTLSTEDFDALIERHGVENVLRYIQHMESERTKYGR